MATPTFLQGFGRDILDFDPELAFFGAISQIGNTRLQEHFRGQFGNIYDRFLGTQGRDLSFNRDLRFKALPDFLEGFDFQREFQSLSPSARGESPARFAPSVRFAG